MGSLIYDIMIVIMILRLQLRTIF